MKDLAACVFCGGSKSNGSHRGGWAGVGPRPPAAHMFLPRWLMLGLPRPFVLTDLGWSHFNLSWAIKIAPSAA